MINNKTLRKKRKDFWESFLENKKMIFLIILLVIILSSVSYFITGWDTYFRGLESNYNHRIARNLEISNLNMNNNDPLSFHKVELHINSYNIIISFFSELPLYFLRIFNIILASILVLLFYVFLRENKCSRFFANLTLLILVFSPIFIYYITSLSVVVIFSILCLLSLLSLHRKYSLLTIVLTLLVPFFGINFTIIYLFLIFGYSLYLNRIKDFYVVFGIAVASAVIIDYFFMTFSVSPFPYQTTYGLVREIISEFGGLRGISVMTLSLFTLGFIKSILDKMNNILQLVFVFSVISLFFFEYRFFFILNFIMSVYAAYGFVYLAKRNWFSNDLKNLTLLIIICGLAFTYLSSTGRFSDIPPQDFHVTSLEWLSQNENGFVLSDPSLGTIIQNVAGMPVLIDSFNYKQTIIDDIDNMFQSRDLEKTVRLLRKYDIKYIYIDENMKFSMWRDIDDGLLFLFTDDEYFKRIYSDESSEIWRFLG